MSPSPSPVPLAARLAKLPPYLFAEIDKQKREARARGVDLIDMGIGDPDLPTPPHIIEAIKRSAETPANHRYPDYEGLLSFRTAVADWYRKRFGVTLDPQTEVLTLIGSKEGTAHMPLAFVNPGDVVLVPDPGYPVYAAGTWFAGGEVHWMPLRRANGFLPDLDAIPADVAKRARLMYLNYPNNPTAAVAGKEFFAKAVDFARRHQIIVCHDAMYSELRFDGYRPPSFLETPGAMEVGVEFHSLSKTYSMTGWRIGFSVGNAGAIAGLGKIKTNVDSGVFQAVQEAGIAALTGPQDSVEQMRLAFDRRRKLIVEGLNAIPGVVCPTPEGAFYVYPDVTGLLDRAWGGVTPASSLELADLILEQAEVAAVPGEAFGPSGYLRFSYALGDDDIREGVSRLQRLFA